MKFRSSLLAAVPTLLSALSLSVAFISVPANAQITVRPAAKSKPISHPKLAIKGYNYTDRPVGDIDVKDEYGNKVNLFEIRVGGAFGPVCCASFKGDKLIITWDRSAAYFDSNPEESSPRSATAIIPPYDRKTVKQIAIHIFPDEHVEVEMAAKKNFMGDDDKLHIVDITRQLWFKNKDLYENLGKNDDERTSRLNYKVSEFVGEAWKKYRMTSYEDLLLYCFWKLMGLNFEIHPKVEALLKNSSKDPGKFADFMLHLPKGFGEELDRIAAKQQKKSAKK